MSSFDRDSVESQQSRDVPSFIEARDPLVTGPGQRPRPVHATNLMDLYESESILEDDVVQVYLRVRPTVEPSTLYDIRSDTVLVTNGEPAPSDYGRRTQCSVSKQHTFSHIFRADATQKQIFDHVVKGNLKKLTEGYSYTLLTYGASGSGKTYTLMGTEEQPGLIPRSLEFVFKLVSPAQHPLHRPRDGCFETLLPAQQAYELELVSRLRKLTPPVRLARRKYRRMSQRLSGDFHSTTSLADRVSHYVWVSFVEIYNEAVYDLLQRPDRQRCTSKPPTKLKICEDPNGTAYVKGATQAFVRTGAEAYDVMEVGRQNLRVAATGVHAHSSRSHCIFTLTLLSETSEGVSSTYIRLCDLAGSERAQRTQNAGARMAESRAINSSLHVLERCLYMLRRKQRAASNMDANAVNMRVPFRESKLTRLLGAPLSGVSHEAVSMVVTVNPSSLYAQETRHVLQLAAVASNICVNPIPLESAMSLESSGENERDIELVTLRAENERLHFEMNRLYERLERQNLEMKTSRQESAATMWELVEEARESERNNFKLQTSLLNNKHAREKERLIEDMTARINELLIENTKLKEQLKQRPLEMAVVESEIQHLHACLAERDQDSHNTEEVDTQRKSVEQLEISDDSDSSSESDDDDDALDTITEEDSNLDSARSTLDKCATGQDSGVAEDVSRDTVENRHTTGIAYSLSDSDDEIIINNSDGPKLSDTKHTVTAVPSNSIDNSNCDSIHNVENETCSFNNTGPKTSDVHKVNCDTSDVDSFLEAEKEIYKNLESTDKAKEDEIQEQINKESFVNPYKNEERNLENIKINNSQLKRCREEHNNVQKKNSDTEAMFSEQMKSSCVTEKYIEDNVCQKIKEALETRNTSLITSFPTESSNAGENMQKSFTLDSITFPNIINEDTDNSRVKPKQRILFDNPVEIVLTEHRLTGSLENQYKKKDQLEVSPVTEKSLCNTQDFLSQFTVIANNEKCNITPMNTNQMQFEGAKPEDNDFGILSVCRPKSEATFFQSKRDSIEYQCRKTVAVLEQSITKRLSSVYDLAPRHQEELRLSNEKTDICNRIMIRDETLPYLESKPVMERLTNQTGNLNITNDNLEESAESEAKLHEAINIDNIIVKDYEIYIKPETKFSLSKDLGNIIGNFNFHTKPIPSVSMSTNNSPKDSDDKNTKKKNWPRLRKKMTSVDKCDQGDSYNHKDKRTGKLKDVANLQQEFSDVTLGVSSMKKEARDIPSLEKLDEEENVPPVTAMTCPAKSTRSRRKLYTPRAEPLEDSVVSDDDSNMRVKVQRPSYHRGTRARRRL